MSNAQETERVYNRLVRLEADVTDRNGRRAWNNAVWFDRYVVIAALEFCARQPDGFMLLDESTEAIEFSGNMGNLEPQEHQAVFACYRIDNPVGETEDSDAS